MVPVKPLVLECQGIFQVYARGMQERQYGQVHPGLYYVLFLPGLFESDRPPIHGDSEFCLYPPAGQFCQTEIF